MRAKENIFSSSAAIFIAAELVLTAIIQFTEGVPNTVFSYLAVILALAFVVFRYTGGALYRFLLVGMLGTAVADFFLVVLGGRAPTVAMLSFLAVQISYFLLILYKTGNRRVRCVHLSVRIGLSLLAALLTLFVLGEGADALAVISIVYFANLILNVAFSFLTDSPSYLFSAGLILFLFCDVFVGFGMIEPYIAISEGSPFYFLAYPGFNAAWLFYVPAQTLIALYSLQINKDVK